MKDFKNEFDRIINLIETKEPLVFVRYGDGETILMDGGEISTGTQAFTVDKWSSKVGQTKLGSRLKESLKHTEKEWIYGIPCECCNNACKMRILKQLNVSSDQVTYANLFVNSNYKFFINWVKSLSEDVFLITNKMAKNNLYKFPFKISNFFSIEDDCVNYFEKNDDIIIEELKKMVEGLNGVLFLVSAGPLAEVLIDELWKVNNTNRYIDVGSSLDEYIHGKVTRPYMVTNNIYNLKYCKF